MPMLRLNGAQIHFEQQGHGPETIVFAHGLLFSSAIFDRQVEVLKRRFLCVTFDFRGQGKSEVTRGGYDIDSLTEDAARLIEALDCAPCHFVGLSMGGFVGLRLALRHRELLKSLALLDSSADQENRAALIRFRILNALARWVGFDPVVDRVMKVLFSRKFYIDPERSDRWRRAILANDRIGITRAVRGVLSRDSVFERLGEITTPTLIVVGDQDVVTHPFRSARMYDAIPGSRLVVLPGVGHMSSIEAPDEVTMALLDFLPSIAPVPDLALV